MERKLASLGTLAMQPKQPKQPQQKKKQKDEKIDPAVSTLVENAVANIISSQSNSSDVKATDG